MSQTKSISRSSFNSISKTSTIYEDNLIESLILDLPWTKRDKVILVLNKFTAFLYSDQSGIYEEIRNELNRMNKEVIEELMSLSLKSKHNRESTRYSLNAANESQDEDLEDDKSTDEPYLKLPWYLRSRLINTMIKNNYFYEDKDKHIRKILIRDNADLVHILIDLPVSTDDNFNFENVDYQEYYSPNQNVESSFNLADLNEKTFGKLFGFLDAEDQMNCRKVNSGWQFKIDNFIKRNWLVIFDRHLVHDEWFEKNQTIDYHNSIPRRFLNLAFYEYANQLQNFIKKLVLQDLDLFRVINVLEKLNQIERLYISGITNDEEIDEFIIRQDNLTAIQIGSLSVSKVIFVTPNLIRIRINSKQEISLNFFYLETIEYAEFGQYNRCLDLFYNAKIIHVDEFTNLNKDFLMMLTEIKEIHTNDEEAFEQLHRQKFEFNRNVKIFYLGINLDDLNVFKGCTTKINENRVQLYLNNYSKMADRIVFETEIDYSEIESLYSRIPNDLFDRFTNLQCLKVTQRIKNESQLIDLAKKVKTLKYFIIKLYSDPSELFNQLAIVSKSILGIFLLDSEENTKSSNLDFLFKFSNLSMIQLNQEISPSFIRHLLTNKFYNLFSIEYQVHSSNFEITLNNGYTLKIDGKKVFVTETIDNLISWLENEKRFEKILTSQII